MKKSEKFLLTAFRGTSAEKIINHITDCDKLLLPNDYIKDSRLLTEQMSKHAYDYVFALGQKPCIKDKIYVETRARAGEVTLDTEADCERLAAVFRQEGLNVKLSYNAGTSYCNRLYFNGLQYISQLGSSTRLVFLHVPFEKNITDIDIFTEQLYNAMKKISFAVAGVS